MRPPTRPRAYVCVQCLFSRRRPFISTTALSPAEPLPSTSQPIPTVYSTPTRLPGIVSDATPSATEDNLLNPKAQEEDKVSADGKRPGRTDGRIRNIGKDYVVRYHLAYDVATRREFSSTRTEGIELSNEQRSDLLLLNRLKNRLQSGIHQLEDSRKQTAAGLPLEEALRVLEVKVGRQDHLLRKVQEIYVGRELSQVLGDLEILSQHRKASDRLVTDVHTQKLLGEFGLLQQSDKSGKSAKKSPRVATSKPVRSIQPTSSARSPNTTPGRRTRKKAVHSTKDPLLKPSRSLSPQEKPAVVTAKSAESSVNVQTNETEKVTNSIRDVPSEKNTAIANLDPAQMKSVRAQQLTIRPVPVEKPKVPGLSFDLSRVLFNAGVYQLQDSRSGVFNFDPYLQRIMPVSEFDFDSLNEYITSSQDKVLRDLAAEYDKNYVGSSSSMTGALTHFHFLLSQFREINLESLSRGFREQSKTFTLIQRAPTALFLRYKEGVYAVDADKEFDSANILMSLGRSMEKLLTLPKEEFERYRKTEELGMKTKPESEREAYHYCEQDNFLMRSQLDAHDPRLPGTGMFDLKTRAVVSIRMNVSSYEQGIGYQIRSRLGDWESYEREYYDMIRSAFLKYSLQVRMGRMDGIFVAFHNIERIFGFQYISLPEMDLHLHGQEAATLGDQEFKLSIRLLSEIFDRATEKFPGRSIRFHFETREGTSTEPAPYMFAFAEPLDEDEIVRIQDSKKAYIAEFEKRIFSTPTSPVSNIEATLSSSPNESLAASTPSTVASSVTTNADSIIELEKQRQERQEASPGESAPKAEEPPILALKLRIRNRVDGMEVARPQKLGTDNEWKVEYTMTEISGNTGRRLYYACQQRRRTAMDARGPDDSPANIYLRRLKEMSQRGAIWRKRQDEIEAQREVHVLYGEKPPYEQVSTY